ncbi:MAG: tripartite tricarboxylate transporter permease [Candidatus Aenigmarchaeota archaeon]|nr:tripartite tricarboxylate transporter permease [Candidatus Aenigmarchaeota archaeon]
MIVEILIFSLFGCFLGIITGIIPGLHVNTISLLLIPLSLTINPYFIAVAIIAMAISHTFFDFIPSIFLGAPEDSTALAVLPGHKMLLEGRGLEALYLTVIGGLFSVLITFILFPAFIFFIPLFYQNIHIYIHWILLTMAVVLIATERKIKKILQASFIFILSGTLGYITLNSYILPSHMIMFPLFTGLFGMNNLLISLNRGTVIPEQNLKFPNIKKGLSLLGIVKGLFSGVIVGTLPGVGASQAAILTQQITRRKNHKEFLVSIGAINTIVALFSLISLYTISKPRSGAAIAVQQILPNFSFNELILLFGVAVFTAGISSFILLKLMRKLITGLQKINYGMLTIIIIFFLLGLTTILTGPIGLFILWVSTSIGLLAPLFGVRRSSAMGVLILPLIIFYFRL